MLAGLRSTSLVQEHFTSARIAANMLLVDWANDGPSLFKIGLVSTPVVQGTPTYPVDPSTVMILDAYMRVNGTLGAPNTDRVVTAISRSEYATYPQKNKQGKTTVYWFDRLVMPTVTLWMVPDGTDNSFNYYSVTQMQDADFPAGQNVDLVYRYLNAFAEGLALKLARIWNPQQVALIAPEAEKAYRFAKKQDVENAPLYITPMLSGYWRI
jgi:hypothetical protein